VPPKGNCLRKHTSYVQLATVFPGALCEMATAIFQHSKGRYHASHFRNVLCANSRTSARTSSISSRRIRSQHSILWLHGLETAYVCRASTCLLSYCLQIGAVGWLVGWSLTSLVSTNTAKSETRVQWLEQFVTVLSKYPAVQSWSIHCTQCCWHWGITVWQ